jgi:hypothetical protein
MSGTWQLSKDLETRGYFLSSLVLPAAVREQVTQRDWAALDRAIQKETVRGGLIFDELRNYAEFTEIEFIISIRSSLEEPDDDGIWHDDGSRVLAFSLSLTLDPAAIEGGKLEIRRRGADPEAESEVLPTPLYGTMIVFATGHQGFEHKINRVSRGERIIIAGWCT